MFESFPTPEKKSTREEIIEALKTKGIEDPETKETLAAFIEASRLKVEEITEKKEYDRASITCSIDNAMLFYEAGYVQEAYDDLLETKEIAYQTGQGELQAKIDYLLAEIGSKRNG